MAQIIDQWGNPVSTAMLKTEQATVTAGSIRRPRVHDEASDLNPVKLARLLRASVSGDPEAYLALAEDMEERDQHYGGVLGSRKQQVAGLEITVEAASDAAVDVENADMIRAFTDRDAFESELIDILDATGKGFSGTEIMWETSESQWQPRELKWRDPRWFRFSLEDGETPFLRDNAGDQALRPYQWIWHTSKTKSGLPIRGGIARSVCWAYLFKVFAAKDWAIFCEAYGQPLRLGKWGEGASEKDKDILLDAVINIGTDYAAIVPHSMTVEFISADVTGSLDLYERRCDWLDRQVSKLILGQTGTTDGISGGYAQAKVHDGVKADIERSDAKQLATTLNRDLVKPYIDLNRGPQKLYPKIKIGRSEEVDLTQWMGNVKTFVDMGGKVGASVVRDKLGIEDPGDDEDLLGAPAKPDDGEKKPALPVKGKTAIAAQRAAAPVKKDAIDISVDELLGDDGWEPLVAPIVHGLEEQIAGATSLDDVRAILADRFKTMDVSAMTDMLARAAFSSRLAGLGNDDLSNEV